ncbi:MAG TPA: TonB-dependent receptor [Pyrinomonadaceae bacterium]|nr:TonB-dependent receptor [Pyrinomonadaceae bacterium]
MQTQKTKLVVFVIGIAFALHLSAQVQNGQFAGTVTDPTGASIANAKVTVTTAATDLSESAATNSNGYYVIKELPIGTYKLTVEAPGFKTASNAGVAINAGTVSHVDFKLLLGKTSEVVEVSGEAAAVNTEDSKLSTIVTSTQINNLPLNGRNVFDLMQLSTGAVNVTGLVFEGGNNGGHGTVVNGVRENFGGFLVNGVNDKGLSGGVVNIPIQDSVEEFQQLQLNMSAQYGSSAGSSVNLVTKSGTNAWHGSAWEYIRNSALDSNYFFLNQQKIARPALHFNQFGLTLGGPIVKDKLFFFLSLQGDRFKATGTPQTVLQESAAWRSAVIQADTQSGLNSTAALLYQNFAPANEGTGTGLTTDGYVTNYATANLPTLSLPANDYTPFLCAGWSKAAFAITPLQAQKLASIFGVTAADQTRMAADGCTSIPGIRAGSIPDRANTVIQTTSVGTFKTQTQALGNLFNGNEGSLRVDYNWNANNRAFVNINYLRETDQFGACPTTSCTRGFANPTRNLYPQGSFSWVHTFSPSVLNEFRAGYDNNNTVITVKDGGVPSIGFSDGTAFFGSYSGYPQAFKENVYSYGDMVSIGHANHNMKVGVDVRRNIENSEFNVGRPSYYFNDQVFFAADAPYLENAGVDPGICRAPCPASSYNPAPHAQLSDNLRHWRNIEFGAYFQDDWKVNKRLTLNLGIRYDLYQRHHEEAGYATTFLVGQGSNLLDQIKNANTPLGQPGCSTATGQNVLLAQLAGICGPGGFAPSRSLGNGDHNNFGPRLGFAWDVFGDGKTSIRGGFGVSYEGTLYNPLSNSRWNLPYYSFDEVLGGGVGQQGNDVVYGPSTCNGAPPPLGVCNQNPAVKPTFAGSPANPNQGLAGQAQAQGNITGWDPSNPNFANLTGIVFPSGVRDPYVYNFFFGVQREILPKTVLDVKYVGTAGHKLFRAEDVNRQPGSFLPTGVQITDNLGNTWSGLGGRLNPNYLKLRVWENQVNSNYNSVQTSLKHQMSRGVLFNLDYTYSHSIDNGSTWHSGATTSNGAAAGEGYTLTNTNPGLDRGNSIYDVRHRLVFNYVWQLPGQNLKGATGLIAGGWNLNGIWTFQSGAHFETYTTRPAALTGDCSQAGVNAGLCINTGGDFNLDGGLNDRPNSSRPSVSGITHDQWANGWFNAAQPVNITFSSPCLACVGNLGRNTFVGPGNWAADMTLSKIFKITERVSMKFDANAFNVFNHTNFILATVGGGAHNKYTSGNFGQAASTLNPREMQFGLKLTF